MAAVPTRYRSSGRRLLRILVALGDQGQHAVAAHHVVDELDRARLADGQGHDGLGKDDGAAAQRQHRQGVGDLQADRGLPAALAGADLGLRLGLRAVLVGFLLAGAGPRLLGHGAHLAFAFRNVMRRRPRS